MTLIELGRALGMCDELLGEAQNGLPTMDDSDLALLRQLSPIARDVADRAARVAIQIESRLIQGALG